MLLNKQKNELLKIMTARGISPHQVRKEDHSTQSFAVRLNTSPFFFRISTNDSGLAIGGPYKVNSLPESSAPSAWDYGMMWPEVSRSFTLWADIISEELQTPDLWAEAAANAELFVTEPDAPDEKFTDHEIRELQAQVRTLTQRLDTAALPAEAKTALVAAVQEAPDKAERFTKKEWKSWFVGSIVSQIT